MSEFKRHYPRPGRRTVKGFFMEADVLGLSLEAAGLAAHICSFDADDIDEEFLQQMFPGRDLSGALRELAAIGLISFVDPEAPKQEPDARQEAVARSGTVYLLEAGGRFKVGVTKSIGARLKSLQTGSAFTLRVVHTAYVADSAEAERLAHALLARFRLRGEWFDCSEDRALAAVQAAIEAVGPGASNA